MSTESYFVMTCDRCGHAEKFKEGETTEWGQVNLKDLCRDCKRSYQLWWVPGSSSEKTKTSAIEACRRIRQAYKADLAEAQKHEAPRLGEMAAEGMRAASRIASIIDSIGPDGELPQPLTTPTTDWASPETHEPLPPGMSHQFCSLVGCECECPACESFRKEST